MSIAPIKLSKRKSLKIQAQINDKSSRKSYFAKRQAKKINNIAVSKKFMKVDKRIQISIKKSFQTIKCNLCGNKNKTMLWKKYAHEITKEKLELPHKIIAQEKQDVAKSSDSLHKPTKKKRRKNDKNAGLLYTSKEETKRVFKEPTFSTMKCKPAELTAKLQKMKFPNINMNADKKKKKNQSLSSQNILVHQKQKRNSLLQLANALKTKDYQQNSSSNNDKLRQLFK